MTAVVLALLVVVPYGVIMGLVNWAIALVWMVVNTLLRNWDNETTDR